MSSPRLPLLSLALLAASGVAAADAGSDLDQSPRTRVTLAGAKAKVRDPLTTSGNSFARKGADAKARRYAALAAPYKAAGITGDRLTLLVEHPSHAMYGTGGGELRTLRQLKAATVMFELLGPGTDGLYTLRRYQFRGDTLVATTSGDFRFRPSGKHYR